MKKQIEQRKTSVSTNVTLNAIRSIVGIVFPLIIFPYVSRILGTEALGELSYAKSIISYFAYIAALGINTYAVREGAKYTNNEELVKQFASEIFSTNLFTTAVAYLLLVIFVLMFDINASNKIIFIYSMSIFVTTLGVEWLNTIYENYFYITIRSIVLQILSLLLVLFLVKTRADADIYAVITVATTGLTSILNILYCRYLCRFRITFRFNMLKHLKKMVVFFANNLAILIYVNSDTTMLGYLVGNTAVGLYYAAVRVYSIPKNLIASMYLATIPRLTKYLSSEEKYKKLLNKIICGLSLLMIPAVVGMFELSKPIILLIAGEEFFNSIVSLQLLSFALLFAIVGGIFTSCVLLPLGHERIVLISTIASACINIGLNLVLIPIFHQNGAAFTTVIAELSVPVIAYFLCRRKLPKNLWDKQCLQYVLHGLVGGMIAFCITKWVKIFLSNNVMIIIFAVFVTIFLYVAFLLIVKNELACDFAKRIIAKLRKGKKS